METHGQMIIDCGKVHPSTALAVANDRITTRASTSTARETTCSRSADANDDTTSLAYNSRGWVVTGNQVHGVNL